MKLGVESRTGAVTVVSRWIFDVAFAAPPQSGLTWSWFRLPGRPGEFRPEPPTDPDVNLSIHPARAPLKKAAAFHQDKEFLRLPVDSILTWVACRLRSTGIAPLPRYYAAVRP